MIKKGPRICVIKLLLKMDFCQKLLMKSFKNVSYFQKILRPMIHTQIIEPIPKPSFPDCPKNSHTCEPKLEIFLSNDERMA